MFLFYRVAVHLERDQPLDADGQLVGQLHHLLRRRLEVQVSASLGSLPVKSLY